MTHILWHNADTNETQIWFMKGQQITARATVLDLGGKSIFVGLPWSIVGAGRFSSTDCGILWHNADTNETKIWFVDATVVVGQEGVLDENGKPIFVGLPWSIV